MRQSLIVLVLVAMPRFASADAVGPPPSSCPPGSTPQSSHAGPLCSPQADCTAGSCTSGTCMAARQCVDTLACGGRRPPDSGPCTVETVLGPCADDGSCSAGECRDRMVCSESDVGGGGGGCGCRAAPSGGHGGALALAGLVALVRLRKR